MSGELPPKKILLVEGVDDKHVVRHVRGRHQNVPSFDIRDLDGFPQLKDAIGPQVKVSGREAIGILADANLDPNGRWQAISEQLKRVDVNPPRHMVPGGAIVEQEPRVGIWLMPDNAAQGELEDFIEKLIPTGDPIWPRAQRFIDEIPAIDRKFATNKILRAQVHAWLATLAEPRKMGAAIGIGELDATAPLAEEFIDWLRRLFG